MLSDKVVTKKGHRSKDNPNGWYKDSQKLDAVKLYLVSGNLSATAAALNVPLSTIKFWRSSKWWKELTEELKREGNIQLSNKLKTIASKALDITMDRLENGDYQYDPKTGEMIRKPVLLRDAHKVASDLITKQLEVDKAPVDEEAHKATQDRLEALAKTFAGFAKKVRKIEVIDAEEIRVSPKETSQIQRIEGS